MKAIIRITLLLALTSGLTGCFRMQIQNGPSKEVANFEAGEWHHTGVFGLVEFSPPVDLSNRCPKGTWKNVQIQETFVQGLVKFITWGLYSPWDMNFNCR